MLDGKERAAWRKLDNAALAFPAAAGRKDSRVFRFYCELKEEIKGETLQTALDRTMEKYPLYQAVLRKGFFWFYLEQRDIRAKAVPEEGTPCSRIYVPDKKSLLFEVSYYQNRINLEVFHSLTDGTGAMTFLCELVKNYLCLVHGKEACVSAAVDEGMITGGDLEEDSFSQYYSHPGGTAKEKKKKRAVQIPGERVAQEEMRITECILGADEVVAGAKAYGTSVTVYLTAILLTAIREELTKKQADRPVTAMIPVNLRKYFPSKSMTNFFGWLEAGYLFEEDTTFEKVVEALKECFARELRKEEVEKRMNSLVKLEKNPVLRAVPLEIKNLFLRMGTKLGSANITAIFSNMGRIEMPEECKQYIRRFGFFTSTDKLQLCACSYGNELYLGMTSKLFGTNIQRNIIELLEKQGISVRILKDGFPKEKEKKTDRITKALKWFTFLCIAASVGAAMAEWMFTPSLHWAWFVMGGAACSWAAVMTAVKKRRNVLKNSLWQLVFISGACIVWDLLTRWKGWSIDFVLPLASLVILFSIAGIAKIKKMEKEEYLFYAVMAGAYGLIPFVLLLTGIINVRYPSVICSGISFLALVWIGIFRFRDFRTELHKKFRL